MAELADAFVALPGGLGTLEELAEVLSWAQLDLHAKPIGLLDVGGYFAALEAFLDHAVAEGFVAERHRRLLLRDDDLDRLLARVRGRGSRRSAGSSRRGRERLGREARSPCGARSRRRPAPARSDRRRAARRRPSPSPGSAPGPARRPSRIGSTRPT